MKKIGLQMNLCMSITLSIALTLLGQLLSGHFSVTGTLISLVLSLAASFLIGIVIPMPKLRTAACRKCGVDTFSPKGNALSAAISDVIYTPVITLCNIILAHSNAVQHGASVPFLRMFIPSLLLSLAAAYVLILLLTPLFLKIILKNAGVDAPDPSGAPDQLEH